MCAGLVVSIQPFTFKHCVHLRVSSISVVISVYSTVLRKWRNANFFKFYSMSVFKYTSVTCDVMSVHMYRCHLPPSSQNTVQTTVRPSLSPSPYMTCRITPWQNVFNPERRLRKYVFTRNFLCEWIYEMKTDVISLLINIRRRMRK